jgi:hypothetical protein
MSNKRRKIMNENLLKEHIKKYNEKFNSSPEIVSEDLLEQKQRIKYYRSWTKDKILEMTREDLYEFFSKLWAMVIWGNKKYAVDKIIDGNGIDKLKSRMAEFLWSERDIEKRWDKFRKDMKGFGPAIMSELLCHFHPDKYIIWNSKTLTGLNYLGLDDLPKYNYQLDGKKYKEICQIEQKIAEFLERGSELKDVNLLTVNYFIWDELQIKTAVETDTPEDDEELAKITEEDKRGFVHDEIKEKLAEIGEWLGFKTYTETRVASGSVVDTVWESTVGNMGRIIYVFEVQTKGSIDSLSMNLLKSLNNPAVQGVIAVSDPKQLEKIKKNVADISTLENKLKFWNYTEVLDNHERLARVNESINKLGLVPEGF